MLDQGEKEVDQNVNRARFFVYIYVIKLNIMYSLDCSYFDKQFKSINALVDYVMSSGMDPNYEITKNGVGIGEEAINYIVF